jgi:Arc/MetJ family transcription regulator
MRTTLDLDAELLTEAMKETRAKSKTEVIEMGLRSLLERAARQRLKALYGRIPDVTEPKRRH